MLSCGAAHVVAVTTEGVVYSWGEGAHGRLGTGSEDTWSVIIYVVTSSNYTLHNISHTLHTHTHTASRPHRLQFRVQVVSVRP